MKNFKPPKQFLLIDDDASFTGLIADVFEGSACQVKTYTDPHEGLREALTRSDLDLIILDIDMPKLNGLEILQQLKKTHVRHVPVMMFTAHSKSEAVQEALKWGAVDYILKPFRLEEFVKRLNSFFQEDLFVLPTYSKVEVPVPQNNQIKTRKILLVDDDPHSYFLVKESLEKSIIEVYHCRLPERAVNEFRRVQPDLVLLDINMPGLDGIDVLKQLRELDQRVPVLMLTSDQSWEKIKTAKQHQVQGYILKPYKYHFFIGEIEKVLGYSIFP